MIMPFPEAWLKACFACRSHLLSKLCRQVRSGQVRPGLISSHLLSPDPDLFPPFVSRTTTLLLIDIVQITSQSSLIHPQHQLHACLSPLHCAIRSQSQHRLSLAFFGSTSRATSCEAVNRTGSGRKTLCYSLAEAFIKPHRYQV